MRALCLAIEVFAFLRGTYRSLKFLYPPGKGSSPRKARSPRSSAGAAGHRSPSPAPSAGKDGDDDDDDDDDAEARE